MYTVVFFFTSYVQKFDFIAEKKKQNPKAQTKYNWKNQNIPFSVIHTYKSVGFVVPSVGKRAGSMDSSGIVVAETHK